MLLILNMKKKLLVSEGNFVLSNLFLLADFTVVDFMLPEKKLILELEGPVHFIKPKLDEMNLVTKFKIQCLEKLDYKVVVVPFNAVSTEHMSLDYFLLQHIKEDTVSK